VITDQLVREALPLYRRRRRFWKRLSTLLGLKPPVYRPIDLAHALGEGLALTAVDSLIREGYLNPAAASAIAPPGTLTHRRHKGKRLNPEKSERVARIGKTVILAEDVFGDKDRALKWLHKPKRRLDGKTPFELLATAEGGELVAEELMAVDQGYVA
jgi:putative toxin-antitoxin system antitoxin component (TIGR02293 family)